MTKPLDNSQSEGQALEGQQKPMGAPDNSIGGKRTLVAQAVTVATATEDLKERPKIEDLQWVHIEDDPRVPDEVTSKLKTGLNMRESLGSAESVEGGINLIRSLAERGVRLDLIISDQEFPTKDDGPIDPSSGCRQFLRRFEELKTDPLCRDALSETKVVIYSSGSMSEGLDQYNFIIGNIAKGPRYEESHLAGNLKVILTNAGVVNAG